MHVSKRTSARMNEHGTIVLPPALIRKLGISPGDEIRVDPDGNGIRLGPSITALRKVYVEITNTCNMNCSTCMRNSWNVAYGSMSPDTFQRILSGLEGLPQKAEVFFGGYGEPLTHPACLDMIERAKAAGHAVTLISNGILLTEHIARRLIELRLDMLWVSLDGASVECYSEVRREDSLQVVIENLKRLKMQKFKMMISGLAATAKAPRLGIAFVAMQRNIEELGAVIRQGTLLGAVEFSISNVLAHTRELLEEALYLRSLNMGSSAQATRLISMSLLDINKKSLGALDAVLMGMNRVELFGALLNKNADMCPFVERGSISIRQDGKVSPCLPLLYTHEHFTDNRKRTSKEFFVGDIRENDLQHIWNSSNYLALRKRLQKFDFSPCAFCNSCDMANDNSEDCSGNVHPSCGGCLWAQGIIRCP